MINVGGASSGITDEQIANIRQYSQRVNIFADLVAGTQDYQWAEVKVASGSKWAPNRKPAGDYYWLNYKWNQAGNQQTTVSYNDILNKPNKNTVLNTDSPTYAQYQKSDGTTFITKLNVGVVKKTKAAIGLIEQL